MSEDIVKGVSRALARGVSRAVLALCAAANAVTFDVDVEGVRPALLEVFAVAGNQECLPARVFAVTKHL